MKGHHVFCVSIIELHLLQNNFQRSSPTVKSQKKCIKNYTHDEKKEIYFVDGLVDAQRVKRMPPTDEPSTAICKIAQSFVMSFPLSL